MSFPSARSVRDSDVAALAALWESCELTRPWNDPTTDIAFARKGPNSDILVVEEGGKITASVMVGHDGHRGWVYYVAVEPALQRGGLGRHMMDEAEHWLRTKGIWKMHLMVRPTNPAAHAFYEKLGFTKNPITVFSKSLT